MTTVNAAHRMDRLPISRFHKTMLFAVAFAYFFEFADINTFAVTSPKLLKVWDITVPQVAYVNSTSFAGMFLGAMVGGGIADRLGRRSALVITTIWFSAFSLLTAVSWNIWSLGIFRVLTSAGLSAMTVVAVIYVSEMFPAAKRGRYQAYAMVIGICGTPATSLLASYVVPLTDWSWRLIYLWGGLGIVLLFMLHHLKESPRWLESNGRHDEAEALLQKIENQVRAEGHALPDAAPPAELATQGPKVSWKVLLRRRNLYPTLLLSVLWITQTIGFFGYSSWAPTLLAKQGFSVEKSILYVALTTVGAPLGCFLASLITDKFERKWSLAVFGVIIGTSGLLYGLTFNPILIVVFGFTVNFFERGYTSLAYAYSPELFDTDARSLGTSFSYGIGRLSNAAGPLIIAAIYTSSGYESVFMFIAGTWILGAIVLAIFGPRTRKRIKEELSAEPQEPTVTATDPVRRLA